LPLLNLPPKSRLVQVEHISICSLGKFDGFLFFLTCDQRPRPYKRPNAFF
jgi:hypothetical protein